MTPVARPWAASMLHATSDAHGGSFFIDAPEIHALGQKKAAAPLLATVIRLVSQSTKKESTLRLHNLALRGLGQATESGYNGLICLTNTGYDNVLHINDFRNRVSRRSGMLLSLPEIVTLFHLPDPHLALPRPLGTEVRDLPSTLTAGETILGVSPQGETVSLSTNMRLRHMHILGATGTGKSTLLIQLILQDITAGRGCMVLDPHGDLINTICARIPEERLKDVVLIDPSDPDLTIGLDLFSAETELEKIVLSSDLVAMFRRLSSSWGDAMHAILSNAIIALVESQAPQTLLDLRRMLLEESFRKELLKTISDEEVRYYWEQEFPLQRKASIAPILTRLNGFLRSSLLRSMMVCEQGISFPQLLREKKIILCKLSQGLIGKENSYLLGTLLVAKLHQAAQARQAAPVQERAPFFLYLDEFQNFITPSMEEILSGARKYGLGLILAHQNLQQLVQQDRDMAASVLANAGSRICFRMSEADAKRLERQFTHYSAEAFLDMPVGAAIVQAGQSSHDTAMHTILPEEIQAKTIQANLATIKQHQSDNLSKRPLSPALETSAIPSKPDNTIQADSEKNSPAESDLKAQAEAFKAKERKRIAQTKHRYLQESLKRLAEGLGCKATLEASTPSEDGKVDVLIQRQQETIGIEISVTNTAEYEAKNIEKCLRAGYTQVWMCSEDSQHLAKIKKIFSIENENVFFYRPEEAAQVLQSWAAAKQAPKEKVVKGYRVKIKYSS